MKIRDYFKALSLMLLLTACDKKEEDINTVPSIENQVFEVLENIVSEQNFAKVVATDKDEDKLLFTIKENDDDTFQVSENGSLSLAVDKNLDFETKTLYKITVVVTDGDKEASAEITIKVTDVDENEAPVIENQTFTVAEDISHTDVIGTIVATDPNDDTLSYSVSDASFEVNNSGELSLVEGKKLDYETKTEHKLTIEVSDGSIPASAEITIKVTDVDENEAPVIENQTFTVAEDISHTDVIGTIVATDPNGDTLSYSVSDTNFEINNSGELSLVEWKKFDYEKKTEHKITVEVSDGSLTASAEITIKVTDVDENEAPVIENQTFTVAEDISHTDVIGAVVATDPNDDTLSYSVSDANFEINNSGELSLVELKKFDYEKKTEHKITVEVSDGSLTASAEITIKVTDVVEDNIVNIPDANFKNALLAHTEININGDSEIQVSEAENYQGSLYLTSKSISDLTGIEYFTKIKSLYINNNSITNVDLSKNVMLELLSCDNNRLSNLDLTKNTKLKSLIAYTNELSYINLTKNPLLEVIALHENKLTSLDLFQNTKLKELYASKNKFTTLDLSNNPALAFFDCRGGNRLININVANGNNGRIHSFNVQGSINLTCIQIDTHFEPSTTTWKKENMARYSYGACPRP